MKKKTVKKQKSKQKRKPSPVLAFLLTLVLVLSAGFLGMLMYAMYTGKTEPATAENNRSTVSESETEENNVLHSLWEEIPENLKAEAEETEDISRYGDILSDSEYMAANRIYEKPNKTEGIVSIGFAGDILFDDEYAMMANLLRRGVTMENGISEALLARMQEVDIMMLNNEFPYTDRGTSTEGKTYTFRADTSTVSYLDDMGADVVSLANNHIYDFGETGLLDTLTTLEEAGIPYVGAGRNLEEASAPVYFISGDIKIAIVAATQIERLDNPDTKGATESSAGTFRCWNPEKLYEVVAKAKENSDFVIAYIHWGTENVEEPDWAQLQQAEGIAQAGADLIIGDHPHCLQGIQYFGDTPVIYSLGNFWFNSKTLDTCMIEADISKDGLESLRFVPAIQSDCRTDLAYGTEKDRIISYMNSISYDVSIDADGVVTKNN
ncbi:MAG: CapA family protein [Suilimivivens sp.]